ncbi:uncharacterized protein MELLADRAFT_60703 [Melampsora larici-populina 98AG31]|uniref:Uncharacterized protein n=1 Tax=Melampsora larici-populina (strain 98AG31 / pathotype 3-4-7) TaxID=747676 RepID=F4RC10_MELLP|nr:uncharacterized protein MELLADRAFT_60703 [Melampsora larici-populina 98AG31]EGG10196.1 hypothetical protein MELLADRAFT_60703 [Melampsora larici-populina 98AG31]
MAPTESHIKELSSVWQSNSVGVMIHHTPMLAPLMRAWQTLACAMAKDGKAAKEFMNMPDAFTWVEFSDKAPKDASGDKDSVSEDKDKDDSKDSKSTANHATSPTPNSKGDQISSQHSGCKQKKPTLCAGYPALRKEYLVEHLSLDALEYGKDEEVEELISDIKNLAPLAIPFATVNHPLFVAFLKRPPLEIFRHNP